MINKNITYHPIFNNIKHNILFVKHISYYKEWEEKEREREDSDTVKYL